MLQKRLETMEPSRLDGPTAVRFSVVIDSVVTHLANPADGN
jgi:hypothetical protein